MKRRYLRLYRGQRDYINSLLERGELVDMRFIEVYQETIAKLLKYYDIEKPKKQK